MCPATEERFLLEQANGSIVFATLRKHISVSEKLLFNLTACDYIAFLQSIPFF